MGFIGAKVSSPEILEWLKSKENQSQVIKEALEEKRMREITPIIEEQIRHSNFRIKRVIT